MNYTEKEQFAEVQKLFASGRLNEAWDICSKLFENDPGNPDINFQMGRISFAKGDYESAIMAYERILIMDPNATRIKLEMARCYLSLGSKETARQLFREVLDTNPPENVKKNIYSFLAAIKKSEKKHFFTGIISFGTLWDDNAATAPSHTEHQLPDYSYIFTTEPEKADYIYSSTVLLNYLFKPPETYFSWKASAIGYNATYNDNKELNLNYFSGTTGPYFQGKKLGVNILGLLNHLILDEEEYLTSFGAETTLSYLLTKYYMAELGFKWEKRNYVGQIPLEKDSNNYNINMGHILAIGPYTCHLKVEYEIEDAQKKYNSYKRIDPSLNVFFKLPYDITLTGRYTYQYTKYDEDNPDYQKTRLDDTHEYSAGISKIFWRSKYNTGNFSGIINYSYTDAISNIAIYDYHKNTVNCGMTLAF